MNALVKVGDAGAGAVIEQVIIKGDLSQLNADERMRYYMEVCRSVGLNPMTKPFEYITLNGKLTLYALRACTDQLRNIHAVSVLDLQENEREGVFVVTAKVQNGAGRTDMAKGAVAITGLKGEALANALMKAETKAKRRATLSICGLGWLDESEVDSIPGAVTGPPPAPRASISPPPQSGQRKIEVPEANGKRNWVAFGTNLIAAFKASSNAEELQSWVRSNDLAMQECMAVAPKVHKSIAGAYTGRAKELTPLSPPSPPSAPGADHEVISAYADWLSDTKAELAECDSQRAVEDLRDRALNDLEDADVAGWKDACAARAAELARAA